MVWSDQCTRKKPMKLNPLQDDLVELFAHADARQLASARAAVAASTEKSLRGRKLTPQNMRGVIKLITRSTAAGAAQNTSPPTDVQALLSASLQGIDDALQRTVEASEQALQGFIDEGVDVRDTMLKSALDDLEKLEAVFVGAVTQVTKHGSAELLPAWTQAIEELQRTGTRTAHRAAKVVQQVVARAERAANDSDGGQPRTDHPMLQSYSTLVSGVLIGMAANGRP
jgi:flagellar hook-basal body complex protein FliE